ncbi:hypothetical protein P5673_026444 [Acropora cervicornis]|uniref:Uncharacterized protein n=1 Tax=Acropora cervicornis TaxID=6130 RepID=A0AAD9UWB3_ACRCE|nr:hypothetical protein P5673_026444 [Acropora cervicornis]
MTEDSGAGEAFLGQIERGEFQPVHWGIFKPSFNHSLRFFHVLANISSPGNIECALACLRNEACLSFNFAILPYTISELYTCQLLPIDKYWNPDRFALSQQFHHYAIPQSFANASDPGHKCTRKAKGMLPPTDRRRSIKEFESKCYV